MIASVSAHHAGPGPGQQKAKPGPEVLDGPKNRGQEVAARATEHARTMANPDRAYGLWAKAPPPPPETPEEPSDTGGATEPALDPAPADGPAEPTAEAAAEVEAEGATATPPPPDGSGSGPDLTASIVETAVLALVSAEPEAGEGAPGTGATLSGAVYRYTSYFEMTVRIDGPEPETAPAPEPEPLPVDEQQEIAA